MPLHFNQYLYSQIWYFLKFLDAVSDDRPHFSIQSVLNIWTQSLARLEQG